MTDCCHTGSAPRVSSTQFKSSWITLALTLAGVILTVNAEEILPRPDEIFKGKIGVTRLESTPAWPAQPAAKKGAPNVVLILLDDVGFGASSTFGGLARTPKLDQLAADGIRYNNFHTVGVCSPTRAALLTGRNHHQVGWGNLQEYPSGFPGYTTLWKKETASIAEVLRQNGYNTAAFGKWHNTPNWEISPAGPFDRWPTGLGFEYFYGFLGGTTSQYEPILYRNTLPAEPPTKPAQGYHLTTDLVDDALRWLHGRDAVAPGKPYFLYFSTGAVHNPHHVPKEWIVKSKGRYDQGWDKFREDTFARQKRLGVVPSNAKLTPRPPGLPAWDSLSSDQKHLYARQMEIYSAYLEHTDHEVGRLVDQIRRAPGGQNTLILYVVGDNGGSSEGTPDGTLVATWAISAGFKDSVASQLEIADQLGGPDYDNHYAGAWAWASSTPFQWMKQVASHFGGTKNPLVVSWPGHVNASERMRSQFSHVNDIAATIYDASGVTPPDVVNGTRQIPLEGKSLLPSFADPQAPETHTTQYFELFGNRAIYKDGWIAAAKRDYEPWNAYLQEMKLLKTNFDSDRWELYDVRSDYSEADDLAAIQPEKLAELKAEFDREARRNGAYPLAPMPRPLKTLFEQRKSFLFPGDVGRLPALMLPPLGGRSHRIEGQIWVPEKDVAGVIVALGGRSGGFSLYVKDGRLAYESNAYGRLREVITSKRKLPSGAVKVSYDFTAQAESSKPETADTLHGAQSRPGIGRLYINDELVGESKLIGFGGFSRRESIDIGLDRASPVSNRYEVPFAFNGKVHEIRLDLGEQ